MCKKIICDIAIIDTGNNVDFQKGITIKKNQQDNYVVVENCYDNNFHGTAINSIISDLCDADCFNISIFENSFISIDDLIFSLNYYYNNISSKILLISSGVIENSLSVTELENIINKIYDNNTLIISAFSNEGYLSYPAVFSKVVGVEEREDIISEKGKYIVNIDGYVNVQMPKKYYRAIWNEKKSLVSGNSFAAASLAANIYANFKSHFKENMPVSKILENFFCNSKKIQIKKIKFPTNKSYTNFDIIQNIKKAIVFPFSKENRALAIFKQSLNFEISHWCDTKYSGLCGTLLEQNIPYEDKSAIIEDIFGLDWEEDFDTVILGHIEKLSRLIKFDFEEFFVEKARLYSKKIYSYDKLKDQSLLFYPEINEYHVNKFMMDKYYFIGTLVMGIFGTSSRQGKFTLQMKLKNMFELKKIKLAYLSTEPLGYLMGADAVFPYGYNSNVRVTEHDSINVLNNILHLLELKSPDLIMVGAQSGSVPFQLATKKSLSFKQLEFLIGTSPDIIILCVNTFDDINYIRRTINFIEGVNGKVIALAFLPFKYSNLGHKLLMTDFELNEYRKIMFDQFGLPLININNVDDIELICEYIINKYSTEGD